MTDDTVAVPRADLETIIDFMETRTEFDEADDPEIFHAFERLLAALQRDGQADG